MGIRHLVFNENGKKTRLIKLGDSIGRNKIYDLRAAIYQTCDDELKTIKTRMIQTLTTAERNSLLDFIGRVPCHLEIED